MKTKILIIEDNFSKSFVTKQILETQLKVKVQIVDVPSCGDLAKATVSFSPDVIMFRPQGGVVDVLEKLKRRHANRRNTIIQVLVTGDDISEEAVRRLQSRASAYVGSSRASRDAAVAA